MACVHRNPVNQVTKVEFYQETSLVSDRIREIRRKNLTFSVEDPFVKGDVFGVIEVQVHVLEDFSKEEGLGVIDPTLYSRMGISIRCCLICYA